MTGGYKMNLNFKEQDSGKKLEIRFVWVSFMIDMCTINFLAAAVKKICIAMKSFGSYFVKFAA